MLCAAGVPTYEQAHELARSTVSSVWLAHVMREPGDANDGNGDVDSDVFPTPLSASTRRMDGTKTAKHVHAQHMQAGSDASNVFLDAWARAARRGEEYRSDSVGG